MSIKDDRPSRQPASRLESVDIFRMVAIVAVIVIHTTPFSPDVVVGNDLYKWLDVVLDQSSRFAVPFFFAISGYFWGTKVRKGGDPIATAWHTGKRILVILIAWSLIYLLLPLDFSILIDPDAPGPLDAAWQNMVEIAQHPKTLLLQGTKLHLWYLVALLWALAISAFFLSLRQPLLLAAAAIALYVLGLLGKSYLETPIGLDLGINTRNGPFASTLLFATGYWLSGRRIDSRWALYGAGVFVLGYLLHFIEIIALWKAYGRGPKAHDYTVGTFVMGTGFAMAALSNHPALRSPMLARFGQMTLGIYAVHFVFVDLLRPIDRLTDNPLWEIGYVFLVLGLALLTTWLLSLNRITRKIVV